MLVSRLHGRDSPDIDKDLRSNRSAMTLSIRFNFQPVQKDLTRENATRLAGERHGFSCNFSHILAKYPRSSQTGTIARSRPRRLLSKLTCSRPRRLFTCSSLRDFSLDFTCNSFTRKIPNTTLLTTGRRTRIDQTHSHCSHVQGNDFVGARL